MATWYLQEGDWDDAASTWNSQADGQGEEATALPWINGAYASDDVALGDQHAGVVNLYLEIPTGITGTCYMDNLNVRNKIRSGQFVSNDEFYVYPGAEIYDGVFDCSYVYLDDCRVYDGTFNGYVEGDGLIFDGTFNGEVYSWGVIIGGKFNHTTTIEIDCYGGVFLGTLNNTGYIYDGTFGTLTSPIQVTNDGYIYAGQFHFSRFDGLGEVSGGIFHGSGFTGSNTLYGGDFHASGNYSNAMGAGSGPRLYGQAALALLRHGFTYDSAFVIPPVGGQYLDVLGAGLL